MAIWTAEERATYALGELYQRYGYKRFKVSKFEEYDLYMQNRNFLASRQILTFTNTDGKLMALKPDVTLSIVKNRKPGDALKKLYYTEQVYRAPDADAGFREITQTGLELIGDIDLYSMAEVVYLAAKSLEALGGKTVLDLSHIGVLSGALSSAGISDAGRGAILRAAGRKNRHEAREIAAREGLSESAADAITSLIGVYGPADEALARAQALPLPAESREALAELRGVMDILDAADAGGEVYLDFSIVNDMDYYNGIVFQGYVEGVTRAVISGGRYDNLLARMGKPGGAIGFAVYLDQLERLGGEEAFDVDTLLVYGDGANPAKVMAEVSRLTASGKTVRAQRSDDGGVRCREKIELREEERL